MKIISHRGNIRGAIPERKIDQVILIVHLEMVMMLRLM